MRCEVAIAVFYQNRQFVGVLEAFPRVFRPVLISFGLYFRFESQGRQNGLSTYPPNGVSSHVPSCRASMGLSRKPRTCRGQTGPRHGFHQCGIKPTGSDTVSPDISTHDLYMLGTSFCLCAALLLVELMLTTASRLHSAPAERMLWPCLGGEASRALGVEKPADKEPSGHRFLQWVVRHLGWPYGGGV